MKRYDKDGLTLRERDVYNYVVTYKFINNISPSMNDIADALYTSRAFVRICLRNLEDKGVLTYDRKKGRSIVIKKFL